MSKKSKTPISRVKNDVMSQGPQKGSAEYNRNERIINKSPFLKNLKSTSQGEKSLFHSGYSGVGKGSAPRPGNEQAYRDNWEKIFGKKDK